MGRLGEHGRHGGSLWNLKVVPHPVPTSIKETETVRPTEDGNGVGRVPPKGTNQLRRRLTHLQHHATRGGMLRASTQGHAVSMDTMRQPKTMPQPPLTSTSAALPRTPVMPTMVSRKALSPPPSPKSSSPSISSSSSPPSNAARTHRHGQGAGRLWRCRGERWGHIFLLPNPLLYSGVTCALVKLME